MVIGDGFAWAHVPKTGGDAAAAMFSAVPGLVHFADAPGSNDKHAPFFTRAEAVRGKLLVMSIRRLPAWALSYAHHKSRQGLYPEYRPLPMPSSEEMVEDTHPDDMLLWMFGEPRVAVDRWLRTERLADDVLRLLGELGVLNAKVIKRVRAVGRMNAQNYDHEPAHHFTVEQIRRIYARNPTWAEIERAAFGELPHER